VSELQKEIESSKALKTIFVICAIVGGIVGAATGGAVVTAMFRGPQDSASIDQTLIAAASEINRNMPTMVDQITRIDSTAALPGKKLMYRYTLLDMSDLPGHDDFVEMMRPAMINNYRTSADMADLRKWGVTLVYSYGDETGKEFARFEISPQDIE
jgi:hypothetical protein